MSICHPSSAKYPIQLSGLVEVSPGEVLLAHQVVIRAYAEPGYCPLGVKFHQVMAQLEEFWRGEIDAGIVNVSAGTYVIQNLAHRWNGSVRLGRICGRGDTRYGKGPRT